MSFSLNIYVPPEGGEEEQSLQNKKRNITKQERRNNKKRKLNELRQPLKNEQVTKEESTTLKEELVSFKSLATEFTESKDDSPALTTNNVHTEDAPNDQDPVVHSRKNPEKRARHRAPYSVMREILQAPSEELPTVVSSHLFETRSDFESLGLVKELAAHVSLDATEKGMGLKTPTIIQTKAIPVLLARKDCLIQSETGSGKTLTYLLPILHSLLEDHQERISRADGTYALVLAPTRELCTQIFDVLITTSKPFHWIVSTAIVGGEKKKSEKARLRKGVNIIVATPGRLADHLRTTESLRSSLQANALRWLVLDEADRLLDSGFEKQIEEIINTLKSFHHAAVVVETQTVLLSATITTAIERLAKLCLQEPVRIEAVGKREGVVVAPSSSSSNKAPGALVGAAGTDNQFVTPKQLVQHYLLVESKDRLVGLAAYLRRHIRRTGNTCKTLVFVSSRACAEFLQQVLSQVVWPPLSASHNHHHHPAKTNSQEEGGVTNEGLGTKWFALHGSVDQKVRRKTIKEFSVVRGGVLICTDVAARGLDLPDVDLVVQHDPPSEVSEYVHRVGRTCRSGRRGAAVMFLRESEMEYLNLLKRHNINVSPVKMTFDSLLPPPPPDTPLAKKKRVGELVDPEQAKLQLQETLETMVSKNGELTELARTAYLSWVGAYAVHSAEEKKIFVTRELHFGHVARSFALKEPPTKIKQSVDQSQRNNKTEKTKNTLFGSKNEQIELDRKKKEVIKARNKKFDTNNEFEA